MTEVINVNDKIETSTPINKVDERPFYQFLNKYRLTRAERDRKEKPITHTTWGRIMGAYSIPNDKLKKFHELYEELFLAGSKLSVIEQHREQGPLVIDLDFRYNEGVKTRQYTDDLIKEIVKLYVKHIRKIFNLKNENKKIISFVFERDNCYEYNGDLKDGVHIMFPEIVSIPDIQYVLRNNVMDEIKSKGIFNGTGIINELHEIIDRSVIKTNGWFMFGSGKPYTKSYKLTKVYDKDLNKVDPMEHDYKGLSLTRYFSIIRHEPSDCDEVKSEYHVKVKTYNRKLLQNKFDDTKKCDYNYPQLLDLVKALPHEFLYEYEKWVRVGWALYNIDSSKKMFKVFNVWSKTVRNVVRIDPETGIKTRPYTNKYDENAVIKVWRQAKDNGGLGMGTMHYWVKKHCPKVYDAILRKHIIRRLDDTGYKTLNTNYDVACVAHHLWRHEFVCTSIKHNTWYEFDNHRWQLSEQGIKLRTKISDDLISKYEKLVDDYETRRLRISSDKTMDEMKAKEELEKIEDRVVILMKVVEKLKTTSFKDNVMKECKQKFYDKKFEEKLDSNNYLIGFDNGIYDLKQMRLRKGTPEDYVTLSTGYNFVQYTPEHKEWKEIQTFMTQILPNYHVRKFFLKLMASHLQGYNAEEKFRILTGSGGYKYFSLCLY